MKPELIIALCDSIVKKHFDSTPQKRGPRGLKGAKGESFDFIEHEAQISEIITNSITDKLDVLKLRFEDLTDEDRDSLKLSFSDLSESEILSLKGTRGQKGKSGRSFNFEEEKEAITTIIENYVDHISNTFKLHFSDLSDDERESLRGARGPRGIQGKSGLDGQDGLAGKDGLDGQDGKEGPEGQRGARGVRGQKGKDGESFSLEENKKEIDETIINYFETVKNQLALKFEDLTVENKEELKLKYEALTDEQKLELRGPRGLRGQKGSKGVDGLSAYDIWSEINKGEEGDFLRSLIGPRGIDGLDGLNGKSGVDGRNGKDGEDGKDAPVVTDVKIKKIGKDIVFEFEYSDGLVIRTNRIKFPTTQIIHQLIASGGFGGTNGGGGVTNHSGLVLDDGTNPHGTTQSDVGLSNVDNTSDLGKPISTATQSALDNKLDATEADYAFPTGGSGMLSNTIVTIETPTSVRISAGSAFYSSNTSDGKVSTSEVSWPETVETVPAGILAVDQAFYITKDNTGTTQFHAFPISTSVINSQAAIVSAGALFGTVFTIGSGNFGGKNQYISQTIAELFLDRGPRLEGVEITPDATDLTFNVTSGQEFFGGNNWRSDRDNPNHFPFLGLTDPTFVYAYQDPAAANGWTSTLATVIDNDNYDDATGTLATVPPSDKVTIQPAWLSVTTGTVIIQYGQAVYKDVATALAALPTANEMDTPAVANLPRLGWLVVTKGQTQLIDATYIKEVVKGTTITGAQTVKVQDAYNNSAGIEPELTTNATNGALSIRRGSALDTDNILEGQNGSGSTTFSVDGNGNIVANNMIATQDADIIALAQTTDSTLSYSGDTLTGVSYVDSAFITSNAKVLAYTGSTLDSVTHTFTYDSQVWTVTTTLTYTSGKLTDKAISIGKV